MIPMTGLYSMSQFDAIVAMLEALRGKCSTCIIYTRPLLANTDAGLPTNPIRRLTTIALDHGIRLIGGISLHGGGGASLGDIHDYVEATNYTSATQVYAPERWAKIAETCLNIVRATKRRDVCIVSEPDPKQLGLVEQVENYRVALAWQLLGMTNGLQSVRFWLDQPTIVQDGGPLYARILQAALGNRVRFMPLEPLSLGVVPESDDWRASVALRWFQIPCVKHHRLCVSLEPDDSFPWSPDTARAACGVGGVGYWMFPSEPVLYLKHDDGLVDLARAL